MKTNDQQRELTFTGNSVGGGTTVQAFTFSQFGFQTFAFNPTFSNLAFVDFGPSSIPTSSSITWWLMPQTAPQCPNRRRYCCSAQG